MDAKKGWKALVIAAAFAGCASVGNAPDRQRAVGYWSGAIDRGGWREPMAFQIENHDGSYHGEWWPGGGAISQPFEAVTVNGDAVRMDTGKLVFAGRFQGGKLAGTVSNSATDAPEGDFSVTYGSSGYDPGSEPSFPLME
jgi:hypothetical protein